MYNAATKLSLVAVFSMMLFGCTSSEKAKDETRAKELVDSATMLQNAGRYTEALTVINSIDSLCPMALETRKKAHILKPELMMGSTSREISQTDSLIAETSMRGDSLMKLLAQVKMPYEPVLEYAQLKSVSPRTTQGLFAQLSVQGLVYHLTASAKGGRSSASVRVTDTSTGDFVATPVIDYDGERNRLADNGYQLITLTEAESAPIGQFILAHRANPITLSLVSAAGTVVTKVSLPAVQINGAATLYELMSLRRDLKGYHVRAEHLNTQLDVLRKKLGEFADQEP